LLYIELTHSHCLKPSLIFIFLYIKNKNLREKRPENNRFFWGNLTQLKNYYNMNSILIILFNGAGVMARITLRQLEIFSAVAKNLSVSKAAKTLNLSQPAVSKQIQQLEIALGVPVVDIIRQRVFMTDTGRTVLKHAHLLDQQLESLKEAIHHGTDILYGKLSIAAASGTEDMLLEVMGQFAKTHPEITFDLNVAHRDEILGLALQNKCDLCVITRANNMNYMKSTKIRSFNYVVVAAKNHPLADTKNIDMNNDLSNETFIVFNGIQSKIHFIERFFPTASNEIKTMNVNDIKTICKAVAENLGVAIIPDFMLEDPKINGKIVRLDVEDFPIAEYISIGHLRNKKLPEIARIFLDFVVEKAGTTFEDQNTKEAAIA
jgi:LysR family transcriptional regulator, low CO2-responsive transcriptional regulator